MDRTLGALQRKLERMELEHLRQHALELHEQLERSEDEARRAEESAEYWRESYMQMQEAFYDEGFVTHRCIGINKAGELMVVKHEAPNAPHERAAEGGPLDAVVVPHSED